MVTVTKHFLREDAEGNNYSMLELTGDMEIMFFKASGRPYATARRCSMPATFAPEVCIGLLGKQIPGSIKKIDCESYDYTVPETGETIQLEHRWQYAPETTGTEEAVFGSLSKKPSIIKVAK